MSGTSLLGGKVGPATHSNLKRLITHILSRIWFLLLPGRAPTCGKHSAKQRDKMQRSWSQMASKQVSETSLLGGNAGLSSLFLCLYHTSSAYLASKFLLYPSYYFTFRCNISRNKTILFSDKVIDKSLCYSRLECEILLPIREIKEIGFIFTFLKYQSNLKQ